MNFMIRLKSSFGALKEPLDFPARFVGFEVEHWLAALNTPKSEAGITVQIKHMRYGASSTRDDLHSLRLASSERHERARGHCAPLCC